MPATDFRKALQLLIDDAPTGGDDILELVKAAETVAERGAHSAHPQDFVLIAKRSAQAEILSACAELLEYIDGDILDSAIARLRKAVEDHDAIVYA